MRHPRRFVADFVDGELTPARRKAVEGHLSRCAACRNAVRMEENVRNRLKSSGTPGPAGDLCARIIDRTRAEWEQGCAEMHPRPDVQPPGFGFRRRMSMALTGGVAVVSLATLAGAYALGAESESAPAAADSAASALVAGWQSVAEYTPAKLDAEQLERLRRGGWYCPELSAMGFDVVGADAITVRGRPTLRMVLADGSDRITIYESRKLDGTVADAPVNAVTGNSVTADGFERIGGTSRELWVHPEHSWHVVLDSASVTYTVVSSLPTADMPGALAQLVLSERSQLAAAPPPVRDDPLSRILRGLSKLTQPAGAP